MRGVGLLCIGTLLPALGGCATMRESVDVRVLSSEEERSPIRHDAANDRIEAQAKAEGDMVLVAVRVEPVCTTTVTERRHVEITRRRTPEGLFMAEVVTFIASAGVAGITFGVDAAVHDECPSSEPDCIDGGKLVGASVAIVSTTVAAISGIMIGIDLLRSLPSSTDFVQTVPPQVRQAPCTAPATAGSHSVSLLFADGTKGTAVLAPGDQVVRIPLPEGLRARFPDGLSVRIVVDGKVVGKVHDL